MTSDLPEWAYAGAFTLLPRISERRIRMLVQRGEASATWGDLLSSAPFPGVAADVRSLWTAVDPGLPRQLFDRCTANGIVVVRSGATDYPTQLVSDCSPPAVLFVKGDLGTLDHRRVGVVGTRNATRMGRHFARVLGRDLSVAGVAVVSGLARGIDGEAHAGVVDALNSQDDATAPIGVVASGLDVVYPREHQWLWDTVADRGLLISEYPPGTLPAVHRFPQRNRIIAALSELVIVVESDVTGGSMHTVREAITRGIDVMAVPGAPGMRSSSGTNALISEGCAPVTSSDDVITALGLCEGRARGRIDTREQPVGIAARVLSVLRQEPLTVEMVALRCNLPVIETAICLGQLRQMGWVDDSAGWWEALIAVR